MEKEPTAMSELKEKIPILWELLQPIKETETETTVYKDANGDVKKVMEKTRTYNKWLSSNSIELALKGIFLSGNPDMLGQMNVNNALGIEIPTNNNNKKQLIEEVEQYK